MIATSKREVSIERARARSLAPMYVGDGKQTKKVRPLVILDDEPVLYRAAYLHKSPFYPGICFGQIFLKKLGTGLLNIEADYELCYRRSGRPCLELTT